MLQFSWPVSLFTLGLLPILTFGYIWSLRRRRRFVVRYSSLSLVRAALPRRPPLRRHAPFALLMFSLASLTVGTARPVAVIRMPTRKATIILAMDVSRSMCTVDIAPNRLETARESAKRFISHQPPEIQIGVVAFAGFAQLVQPPTSDRELLLGAFEGVTTGPRTAIGSAIFESLAAIEEISPDGLPAGRDGYAPHAIVLLTDGASNTGALPLDAAQEAQARGVRVYTIGFGTEQGGSLDCGNLTWMSWPNQARYNIATSGMAAEGLDTDTLQQVSSMTGGLYYSASSASELEDVFTSLPTSILMRRETTEISVAFAGLGALLALLAIGLSMKWNGVG
jgi:Ca-activated chloride channel homolog